MWPAVDLSEVTKFRKSFLKLQPYNQREIENTVGLKMRIVREHEKG